MFKKVLRILHELTGNGASGVAQYLGNLQSHSLSGVPSREEARKDYLASLRYR